MNAPMQTLHFRVADFVLAVSLPERWDAARLLPSFAPFRVEGVGDCEELLFHLHVQESPLPAASAEAQVLSETVNDMGHLRLLGDGDVYRIEICYMGSPTHVLLMRHPYAEGDAALCAADPHLPTALSSMLRVLYSQAVLLRGGVSIHAACVHTDGRAYLFLGKSGTGKSTHAQLWIKHIEDTRLLNDDNPTLRLLPEGTVMAYGTPWSGKTPCYRQAQFPVGGIVRLRQASENRYRAVEGPEAFMTLLPSCSALKQDEVQQDSLFATLARVAEIVRVGQMDCLPNEEAARLCYRELKHNTTTIKSHNE